ncbi:MAG: ABC transporter substrate-binding protein [Roseomonas sp.]|nr:ABC transporter substrate-binding protein [Roseomonas sp.]
MREPKDLEGRRLAAPEGDAGRQIFPVFAEAAGFDASRVNWISVSPELREPMLVRGQADAITGLVSSAVISLEGLGVARSIASPAGPRRRNSTPPPTCRRGRIAWSPDRTVPAGRFGLDRPSGRFS